VIDKLDVRIPCDTPFHPEFSKLYGELHYDSSKSPFHPSRHYLLTADLRKFGHDAILHLSNRWGKYGNHKLELIDTGKSPFSGLLNRIERVFQINPLRTGIMRLDLAVDVPGVAVSWFQNRVKAAHKRFIADFGSATFVEMGKGGIQTLYFGKRPSLYRIYDKHAEYQEQYRKLLRTKSKDSVAPDFETTFGLPDRGVVLTRVERQMGGKIPQFKTVGDLYSLRTFDPFQKLNLVMGGVAEPDPTQYSFMEYCTGMYLRDLAEVRGMHATMDFVKRTSKRNTGWALEKFKDFLPVENSGQTVTSHSLKQLFQRSVARQLAA
jgi:hypothetical protein